MNSLMFARAAYRPDLFYSVGDHNSAVIRADGTTTRHYAELTQINALLNAWGPTLMQLTNTAVLYIESAQTPSQALAGGAPAWLVQNLTAGYAYLLGQFAHADGRTVLMLMNYWENNSILTAVTWAAPPAAGIRTSAVADDAQVLEIDAYGNEVPVQDDAPLLPGLQLAFNAAQARLFVR